MRLRRVISLEGITHGMVVWFLIGSLLGIFLFIKLYLVEALIPVISEMTEITSHTLSTDREPSCL
ncbi:MAG: hypothetical protein ACJ0RU_00665 [Candidatus Rariloculaceae bacterium]